jgi:dihydropteroate synthase
VLSIDTVKPAVARAALQAGASIVNDVAANSRSGACESADGDQEKSGVFTNAATNDEMWKIVSEFGAGYICMHARGTPQTMQTNPVYADVVREVGEFFDGRLGKLNTCGVASDQVVLDVGIGFGKTPGHNLQLLAALRSFTKWFIGKLFGTDLAARLPASLACASLAVEAGVQIIRTHDVAETVQAVRMTEAIAAARGERR